MEEKISIEELASKRIRLTQKEYSDLMFYLERCLDAYETLKENIPNYEGCNEIYEDQFREIDYIDFGRLVLWGRTMMCNCNKIVRKAHACKNIVGDKKGYPFVSYSKEEGLRELASDGKIYEADPFELMM